MTTRLTRTDCGQNEISFHKNTTCRVPTGTCLPCLALLTHVPAYRLTNPHALSRTGQAREPLPIYRLSIKAPHPITESTRPPAPRVADQERKSECRGFPPVNRTSQCSSNPWILNPPAFLLDAKHNPGSQTLTPIQPSSSAHQAQAKQ